jgi:hypothetical protein
LAVLSTWYPTARKTGVVKLSKGDPNTSSLSFVHDDGSPSETGGSVVVVSGSKVGETFTVVGKNVIEGSTDNVGKSEGPTEGDKDGPSDGNVETIITAGLFVVTAGNGTNDGDSVKGDSDVGGFDSVGSDGAGTIGRGEGGPVMDIDINKKGSMDMDKEKSMRNRMSAISI